MRNVASREDAPDVAANLWRMAAAGGARAIGHAAGILAPDCRADFVVLDGDDVDFEAVDAAAALGVSMFSGNSNRVRDVFVAGRAIVKHGRHPDEEEAEGAFRAALRRLRRAP